jgi:hypothetical protein
MFSKLHGLRGSWLRRLFVADPEWIEAREASEAAGPIVAKMASSFLAPTSFSPSPWSAPAVALVDDGVN